MTEYGHDLDKDLQSSKDRGQRNLTASGIQGAGHANNGVMRTLQARRFYKQNIVHHRLCRMRNIHCLLYILDMNFKFHAGNIMLMSKTLIFRDDLNVQLWNEQTGTTKVCHAQIELAQQIVS